MGSTLNGGLFLSGAKAAPCHILDVVRLKWRKGKESLFHPFSIPSKATPHYLPSAFIPLVQVTSASHLFIHSFIHSFSTSWGPGAWTKPGISTILALKEITERMGQGDRRGKHQQHMLALPDPVWNGNGAGRGGGNGSCQEGLRVGPAQQGPLSYALEVGEESAAEETRRGRRALGC